MTTALHKPVRRVTLLEHRGRRLVVSLLPGDLISVREQGRRKEELFTIAWAYDMAVIARVGRERFEKKRKK